MKPAQLGLTPPKASALSETAAIARDFAIAFAADHSSSTAAGEPCIIEGSQLMSQRLPIGPIGNQGPPSRLRLRGPFIVLVLLLLGAVGASSMAGLRGIARVDQTLHEVVAVDVQRLLVATHVRRLFRSELLNLHKQETEISLAERRELERSREGIRRDRDGLLPQLRRLAGHGDRNHVEVLMDQHGRDTSLAHQPSQPWEAAVSAIISSTEERLARSMERSESASRFAFRALIATAVLSVVFSLMLGSVVLRRVRLASQALHSSEEQLRCVVESAPSLLAVLGADGTLRFVPPRAQTFLGLSLDRLSREPLSWVHADDRETCNQAIADVLSSGRTKTPIALRAVRGDGTDWFASAALTPFCDPAGRVTGIVLQILDITAQTNAERARTVLEEQLRQAQKMESIGRLAGGVAHDFNNLLTAIKGYASLMQEGMPEDHPDREGVDGIVDASNRAAALTHQLLAFSRKQVLVPRVTHLGDVLRRMAKLLTRIIGEDVHLTVSVAPDLGYCLVDIGQIEQIVLNLAVNARQAMPAGGKLIVEAENAELDESYVVSHAEAKVGPHVQLTVSDTGVGMSPEVRQRAFEPFFTTKALGEGTGLGLSVVYGAVRQQNGSISIYSEPGLGTTFRIYFPSVTGEGESISTSETAAPVLGGSESILLVEDDILVRRFSKKALQQLGYVVVDVDSSEAAHRAIEEMSAMPSLLLTDVVLPGVKGPELAEGLLLQHPTLSVLFCSGYSGELMTQSGQLPPGVDLLQKPYDARTLARRVRQAIDRKRPVEF